MNGPKIITIDIETAPLEAWTWGTWQQDVGAEQIKNEWTILSYAAKWLHRDRVIYKDVSGRGAEKIRDDGDLLGSLWDILNEADIVIGHNVGAFDLKRINARMVALGLLPYSPVKFIDTLNVAKKHFGFTSNKLERLSKTLTPKFPKLDHGKFPGFKLWVECLKDNRAAWREMKKYNVQDVRATEQLYLVLRPWMEGHPNVSMYGKLTAFTCPRCGQPAAKRGTVFTQSGEYTQFQCQKCGGWSRSRYTLNHRRQREFSLVQ